MASFIDSMVNPIEDDTVIRKLIGFFENSYKGYGGFYGRMTQSVQKEYHKGEHYAHDKDAFVATLFNCWKKRILKMTKEEYATLYRKGKLREDFITVRNYLKTVAYVETEQQVIEVMFLNVKGDNALVQALGAYSWKSLGEGSGWVHVSSKYVNLFKEHGFDIDVRLYLNAETLVTYPLALEFIKKCDRRGIPYYFKFDEYGNRDDTLVFYSSYEMLPKYIAILEEIKRENPEFLKEIKEPPLLTGKIYGWIGIGSEPQNIIGEAHSFNSLRAKLIEQVIQLTIVKWTVDHMAYFTVYHGKKMTFSEYLALRMTENKIEELKKNWESRVNSLKEEASRYNKPYSETEVTKSLGYSLETLQSDRFFHYLQSFFNQNVVGMVNMLYQQKDNEIRLKGKIDSKDIYIYDRDILKVLKQEMPRLLKTEPELFPFIKRQIKVNAHQFGIDGDMFCFDIGARKKIEVYLQKSEKRKNEANSVIDALKKQIGYFESIQEFDKAEYYREMLAEILNGNPIESDVKKKVFIDYSALRKSIIDEMNEATEALNYQRVGELRAQLFVVEYARSKDNLSDEEKVALYEDKIQSTSLTGDYVSRAMWMQLLEIVKNAKSKSI